MLLPGLLSLAVDNKSMANLLSLAGGRIVIGRHALLHSAGELHRLFLNPSVLASCWLGSNGWLSLNSRGDTSA